MSISNRATLAQLTKMASGEVDALPVDQIAMLLEDLADREACTKVIKAKLQATLVNRYGATAQIKRRAGDKSTGTVHLEDGNYAIKADLPKKVTWDQAKLAKLAETIFHEWKRDPEEYIKITYSVEERKYEAWPSDLRDAFVGARTLGVGTPTFELTPNAKVEAA